MVRAEVTAGELRSGQPPPQRRPGQGPRLAALAALGTNWAGPPPAAEAAPEPPVPQTTPSAAPTKRPVREHHEECDEGGNCTCWSIKRFGPPSEREGYGDDF